MHRPRDRVTRQRELADHFADAAKAMVAGLIDERRDLLRVAGDQQRTILSFPDRWKPDVSSFLLGAASEAGFPNVSGESATCAALGSVLLLPLVEVVLAPASRALVSMGDMNMDENSGVGVGEK